MVFVVFIAIVLWAPFAAIAQEWPPPESAKAEERDWVRLTPGEWLWGDITLFEDLDLYFDSENLDDLKLDWGDVDAFRSNRVLTYTYARDRVATGTATMQEGVISVQTATGVVEFHRSQLLKIIEGELKEINYWSLKASVGLTARAGNTDQEDINAVMKIRREAIRTRFDIDYTGNFSEVEGTSTIDNHRVGSSFKILIKRGFYVTPFLGELYRDEFQNIDIRGTIGVGVGLWLVRNATVDWNVDLGGVYRDTRYVSVEVGESDVAQTGALAPATSVEWDVTGDIEFDFTYYAQVAIPETRETTHHMETLLSIDILGDALELTSNLTWDRVESPKPSADGATPKRDDFRWALGLGVDI